MAHRRRHLPPKLTVSQRRLRYAIRRAAVVVAAALLLAGIYAGDKAGLFGTRPATPAPDYVRYHAKEFRVVRVIDGDTLDVDEPDAGKPATRIRLWGVDTPETKHPSKPVQHFGPEASDFTRNACQGKSVRLELLPGRERCKYGRVLAYVTLPDGNMVNRVLIRQGYGYADPRYDHPLKAEFLALQAQARQGRLGLWKDAQPSDLPYYMAPESEGSPRR